MSRYLLILLFIGLACAQNTAFLSNDFKNQVITFKKADKIIVIKPNQYLYVNDNKMIYKGLNYNNKQLKLKSRDEVILNFNSVSSFRYEMSPLKKAKVGAIIGSLYGCLEMAKILNRPNDMFAFVKILAPLAIPWFGGIGGLLGHFTDIIHPGFSDLMIVGDGEWIILNNKYIWLYERIND